MILTCSSHLTAPAPCRNAPVAPSVQWRIITINTDEELVGLEAIDCGSADRWEPVVDVYYV